MFQLSLFTEFGRLCNPFDYVLGFTFLLMAFHLLFLLFNLRERQRVKLFCLGSASLVLLLHIAALRLSFQFTNLTFDTVATGPAPGLLAQLFAVQLETVAGDLETALVHASGAAIIGRILFVITLIFETMAVVSHHFAARDRT